MSPESRTVTDMDRTLHTDVRLKPLFWCRFDTEAKTQIGYTFGRYRNPYRNHQISDLLIGSVGYFFHQNKVPELKFQVKNKDF